MDNPEQKVFRIDNRIYFNGEINEENVNEAIRILSKMITDTQIESIDFYMNSRGGTVDEGCRLYDYLRIEIVPCKPCQCIIMGAAMSSAVIICMAFEKRIMTENAVFMIHHITNAIGEGDYDIKELKRVTHSLEQAEKRIIDILYKHTKIEKDYLKKVLDEERDMEAKTSLKLGFVTEVI